MFKSIKSIAAVGAIVASALVTAAAPSFAGEGGEYLLPTPNAGCKAPCVVSYDPTSDGGYKIVSVTDKATGASIDSAKVGKVIYNSNGRNYLRLAHDDGKRS